MAAPSWESKGADISTSTAAPSFAVPVGAASGKIVIVTAFLDTAGASVTGLPTGFAAVPGTPVDAVNHHLIKYWKRLTGADVGTYDFTLNASNFIEGAAELYNNCVATGSPFEASPGFAVDNTAGNTSPPVSTSSVGPDRRAIHSATCWAGGTWTPPAGFTKRVNPSVGVITTSDSLQSVPGSTGSLSASTTTNDKRTAHVIDLIGTTVAGGSMQTISDKARSNMLSNRGLAEPQRLSNVDLMSLVLADGAQVLVPKTNATTAEHYNRYLITLRDT